MRAPGPVVLLAALVAATPAAADDVTSGERGAELILVGRAVDAEHRDGLAHLTVTYDVVNRSRFADQAQVSLHLPSYGQVVGLRHRFAGAWWPGRLLDASAATARFLEYVDAPYRGPRGVALISHDHGLLELALSFVPAGGRVGVAYDVVVPTCYHGGRWYFELPQVDDGPAAVRARGATVTPAAALPRAVRDALEAACEPGGVPAMFGGDGLVVSWPEPTSVGATARAVALGTGPDAPRTLEVWLAPQLAVAPRRPAVVFVLDGSTSVGQDGLDAQLAIVRGYLAHQPDARVEIVVARRHASRLFGGLLDADAALARLAALAPSLTLGNGSHLDRGLALGAALLAAAPGPRRLIAFTDDRLRPALTDRAVGASLAALPTDAVVHLIQPGLGPAEVVSDREHHLAAPIAPWGGLVATVHAEPAPRAALAPLLELIRPIRVEAVAIGGEVIADEVREGDGLRHVGRAPGPVTAWVWGRRLPIAEPTERATLARAARLGLALANDLSEDEIRALATRGDVVTRFTSLLAERPRGEPGGLPPTDEGYASAAHWTSSCGPHRSLTASVGRISGSATSAGPPAPDLTPLLDAAITACAAAAVGPWSVTVAIETTGIEVVDVETHSVNPRLARCALEAAWDLELPPAFARFTRRFAAQYTGP